MRTLHLLSNALWCKLEPPYLRSVQPDEGVNQVHATRVLAIDVHDFRTCNLLVLCSIALTQTLVLHQQTKTKCDRSVVKPPVGITSGGVSTVGGSVLGISGGPSLDPQTEFCCRP